MSTEDFGKFVAEQQQKGAEANINWAQMRDEWLSDLESLYGRIIDFLHDYIANGSITYSFADTELNEENIGTYVAKRMELKIGRQHVSLVPIGTLLIGSKGRVDAVGSAGRAQIVLVDASATWAGDLIKVTVDILGGGAKKSPPRPSAVPSNYPPTAWAWKIVSNAPERRFVDLNKDSFFALLMEIANA